jgi:outer membrane protein assembly factor BamD
MAFYVGWKYFISGSNAAWAMSLINKIIILLLFLFLSACATTSSEPESAKQAELYRQAMESVKAGYYDDALSQLQDLRKQAETEKAREQVELSIAYVLYKKGDFEAALQQCADYVKRNSGHPGVAYAYYLQGLIKSSQGEQHLARIMENMAPGDDYPEELRQAYTFFSDLVSLFPESAYTKDATHQATRLRQQLAAFELHAARYDLVQGDYPEALRRARYVDNYFSDPAVRKQAKQLMVETYKQAGNEEQARIIERQIEELSISNPSMP